MEHNIPFGPQNSCDHEVLEEGVASPYQSNMSFQGGSIVVRGL